MLFYDPSAQALRTWFKDGGWSSSLHLNLPNKRSSARPHRETTVPEAKAVSDYDSAAAVLYGIPKHERARSQEPAASSSATGSESCEARPERWLVDGKGRTWMTCNGQLMALGKQGSPEMVVAIPGMVQDMAAGKDGLFLLYRTLKPYVEKRNLQNGAVLWAYGDKAQLKEAASHPLLVPLNRMALGDDGAIYLAEGASMVLTVLDPAKGPREAGQAFFTYQEAIPSRASLGSSGRGPLLAWAGRAVLFSAFAPSQVKSCQAPGSKGLTLARFDLTRGTLDWVPTEISEDCQFVGLLEHEAVFLTPLGTPAFAPIR
ncbi:MAG TPA: hypothetical protein VJ486_13200 [Geothrix sp.]|nr:hypothetical protein [Geothrix sp.]